MSTEVTVGLTGGIGCGKSTVGKLLEQRGFARLDSDALVRELLADDAGVRAALREHWGASVFDSHGAVDRAAVAARVFEDEDELRWLEELLHPRVRERWLAWLERHAGRARLVEIPLLFEKGLEKHFDCVVCIEACREQQFARLAAKGLSREQVQVRVSRQMPLHVKVERADVVLSNSGSLHFLQLQVEVLSCRLLKNPQTA